MKIIVSATGDNLDSQIDFRFGRCTYFLVVEVENNEIKNVQAIKNQGAMQGHGAGIVAAQQVGNLGAEKIITGNLGPNAFRVIQQLSIEAYQASGIAKEAVQQLLEGKLAKISQVVPGHFGMGGGLGRGMGGGQGRGIGAGRGRRF